MTVELHDGPDGGTVVSLRQERSSAPGEGYSAGWYSYLRSLDRFLDGRDASESDWQADWTEAIAMIRP